MTFFSYLGMNAMYIAENQNDITATLEYYIHERGWDEIKIPSKDEISILQKLEIICEYPLFHVDHFITIPLREDAKMKVNANAFRAVTYQVQNVSRLRRGALYKFMRSNEDLIFLPESIMALMQQYDWHQHHDQVIAMLGQREEALNSLSRKGHLIRRTGFAPIGKN